MSTQIIIRKFEVQDFVSIDHGTKAITLTLFHGQIRTGEPGWSEEMEFDPDQAEAIGKELINRAQMVREKE